MECGPRQKRCRVEQTTDDQQYCHNGTDSAHKNPDVDRLYFKSYSMVHVHEEMLLDKVRTNAYRYAILKNYPHLYKQSVMDVGAGTGILSIFAVQAGARKVYAVEASDIVRQMQEVVKENNMANRISIIQKRAENVELPEKVDAIISEWMGYCLFYESMLPSVLRARDNCLRPGGLMFPCKASLHLAPIHDKEFLDRLNCWREMKTAYKVSMESMMFAARTCFSADADIRVIDPEALQAHAVKVFSIDLLTAAVEDVEHVSSEFCFSCFGTASITGFVSWFTVEFPGGSYLSTSPWHEETHWGQTVFYLSRSFHVEQDSQIRGMFFLNPHSSNSRSLKISLDFTVDGHERHKQSFNLYATPLKMQSTCCNNNNNTPACES